MKALKPFLPLLGLLTVFGIVAWQGMRAAFARRLSDQYPTQWFITAGAMMLEQPAQRRFTLENRAIARNSMLMGMASLANRILIRWASIHFVWLLGACNRIDGCQIGGQYRDLGKPGR